MGFCCARLSDALSFFTRFFAAKAQTPAEWEASVCFFFPAGLCLGVLVLLPSLVLSYCVPRTLLFDLVLGWLWVLVLAWCTRALHIDGLADLADALGSGAMGEDFWRVLHDSRIGTFGALTLFLVLTGQWLLASALFARASLSALLALVLAPAWARLAPLWLADGLLFHESSRLGRFVVLALARRPYLRLCTRALFVLIPAVFALLCGCGMLLLLPAEAALLLRLRAYARVHGGVSGDFFGAAIELSQLLFLVVAVF